MRWGESIKVLYTQDIAHGKALKRAAYKWVIIYKSVMLSSYSETKWFSITFISAIKHIF
jgi:hypothetical protein